MKNNRWMILIASCLVAFCIGSLYAWSVFASPMAKYLTNINGVEITSLAIVFTIANSVGPITMISGGFINDKLGPKWVLIIGGLLFGAGMIGSGFVTSVGMLIFTYGLGVGLACGMIYGTIVSNTVKFFPDKSGLVGGLITACYGGSSILIPPLATMLLNVMDITSAFKVIGTTMMIIIVGSSFVIQKAPINSKQLTLNSGNEYTYKEMLKKPTFYIMLMVLMCGAFSGMMIISQASSIAQNMMEMSFASAAIVVSIIALANTSGRIISGMISDKIGAVNTMKCTFIISVVANILVYFCNEETIILFYLGVILIGFSFGSIMGIYPSFTASEFGRKNNSVNYGIMFIGFALAGLIGPMAMNSIYTNMNVYQPAFILSSILSVGGFAGLVIFERMAK
ncbi:MAG: OFA family MFS transporter [Bacilli bacterium]|nr:OFA family MFS transporter [Bacilli bacterium]